MTTLTTGLFWDAARPVAETRQWAETVVLPAFHSYGFSVEHESADTVILQRRRDPWWIALFSIIAYWLMPSRRERVILSFESLDDGGSRMTVLGDLPAKIERILRELPGCREG